MVFALAVCPQTALSDNEAAGLGLILADSNSGFAQALTRRDFRFPKDHGQHPDFRTEWWYFTGNVVDPDAREFGFQLTFFRFALSSKKMLRDSDWRSSQAFMAHFAISDIQAGGFRSSERFSRGAFGLAGTGNQPCAVWLDSWRLDCIGQGPHDFDLLARHDGAAISLRLQAAKPPILNGRQGLSRKSAQAGNASYYYSLARLKAAGSVVVGGRKFQVSGDAWMDHEWSSGALSPTQVGWDWFGLQFEDGTELMFYRLRGHDGTTDPYSAGSFLDADGRKVSLSADEVVLRPEGVWRHDRDSPTYPAFWSLTIPKLRMSLMVRPKFADQELRHRFRYWEGAVAVSGQRDGAATRGHGYLEMTGYGGNASPGSAADSARRR